MGKVVMAVMDNENKNGLGFWGNLAIHSQFVMIGILVLGAVYLKLWR